MKLFYRTFGEGKPLIILHGLFGLSDNWVTHARHFAEKLKMTVIVPDQRNHGQSPHHDVFNYFALVDDVYELYNELEISDAVILGHSMGGKVAMHFALEYPQMVTKLIVADISPVEYRTNRHAELLEIMASIDFSGNKSRKQIEAQLMMFLKDVHLVRFLLKNVQQKSRESLGWKLNIESLQLNLEQIFKFEPTSGTFEHPVLVLKGAISDFIQPEHMQAFQKFFPQMKLVVIEGASHWLHADKPEKFANEVISFLS